MRQPDRFREVEDGREDEEAEDGAIEEVAHLSKSSLLSGSSETLWQSVRMLLILDLGA